jgi:hypothetical protein
MDCVRVIVATKKKKTYAEELEEICKKQDEATDEFATSLGLKAELNPQYWRAKRKTGKKDAKPD